jgi:hypothetical protein
MFFEKSQGAQPLLGILEQEKTDKTEALEIIPLRFLRCLMFKSFLWLRCGINRAKSRIVLRQITLNYGQK